MADPGTCVQCWVLPLDIEPIRDEHLRYGAALMQLGNRFELRLDTLLGNDSTGGAIWQRRATFPLGEVAEPSMMVASCGPRPDSLDGRTFAVVRDTNEEEFRVMRAWRIVVREFRIVPVPADSVACINEGWGEEAVGDSVR